MFCLFFFSILDFGFATTLLKMDEFRFWFILVSSDTGILFCRLHIPLSYKNSVLLHCAVLRTVAAKQNICESLINFIKSTYAAVLFYLFPVYFSWK